MVKLTDKDLYYEPLAIRKMDFAIERCTKKNFDNVFLVEGSEGYGKSTLASAYAYYCAWKTGRKYDVNNIFFDTEEMVKFAINNKEQIIHWDEGAMGGLASEWQKRIQKQLIKMLMMARKKKHIYFICVPKFFKLNEYLIDRAVGMFRVYAENEMELGRFVYYNKSCIQKLYSIYRLKHKLLYKKYYTFRGRFTNIMAKIIDDDLYNDKKDKAIASIMDEEKKSIIQMRRDLMKNILINNQKLSPSLSNEQIALLLGHTERNIRTFAKEIRENTSRKEENIII